MRYRLFFFLSLSISFSIAHAQQLFTTTVPTADTGSLTECKAVIYLPPGYSKDKSYPLVIYSHGIGQAGTDITELYETGLPKILKGGCRPSFDFIMIAPQSPLYSIAPQWLEGILKSAQKQW